MSDMGSVTGLLDQVRDRVEAKRADDRAAYARLVAAAVAGGDIDPGEATRVIGAAGVDAEAFAADVGRGVRRVECRRLADALPAHAERRAAAAAKLAELDAGFKAAQQKLLAGHQAAVETATAELAAAERLVAEATAASRELRDTADAGLRQQAAAAAAWLAKAHSALAVARAEHARAANGAAEIARAEEKVAAVEGRWIGPWDACAGGPDRRARTRDLGAARKELDAARAVVAQAGRLAERLAAAESEAAAAEREAAEAEAALTNP